MALPYRHELDLDAPCRQLVCLLMLSGVQLTSVSQVLSRGRDLHFELECGVA